MSLAKHSFLYLPVFLFIAVMCNESFSQFDTVINVPPDSAPEMIGSNTQLNVFDTGSIDILDVGDPNAQTQNVELNLYDGSNAEFVMGYDGAVLNIAGGRHGRIRMKFGTLTRKSGGVTRNLGIEDLGIENGSSFELSGGIVSDLTIFPDTNFTIFGNNFSLNGAPVSGTFVYPQFPQIGTPFDAILTDGSVFFSDDSSLTSSLRGRTITLVETEIPPVKSFLLQIPGSPIPNSLRPGQKLLLNSGGILPDDFKMLDAELVVNGGVLGEESDFMRSKVDIYAGAAGFDQHVLAGSVFTMHGGTAEAVIVGKNGVLNVGGTSQVETITLSLNRGIANVYGGTVTDSLRAANGRLNITGGTMQNLNVFNSSDLYFSGGSIVDGFQVGDSSTDSFVIGTQFSLVDSSTGELIEEIKGIPFGEWYEIVERDVTLTGVLADGSPFEIDLDSELIQTNADFDIAFARNFQVQEFGIIRGNLIAGELDDLHEDDGAGVMLTPGFVLYPEEAPVNIEFDGEIGLDTPNNLRLIIESHASTPGLTMSLEAKNFTTGDFESIVDVDESFASDSTVIFELPDPAEFIGSNRGQFRASWKRRGLVINFPWQITIDRAGWSAN